MSTNLSHVEKPHMAMLVANPVVGDSRVEKSALSAVRAGYRVTIVGVGNASTSHVDHYEHIPIYRIPLDFSRHKAWTVENRRRNSSRAPETSGTSLLNRANRALQRMSQRLNRSWAERFRTTRESFQAGRPGGWRTVWPQTLDYEEGFLEVLHRLKPDIIHAHDRHPMAGAAAYSALQRAAGTPVPWVYDAHEWVPGTIIGGPPQAKTAWVALEAELIRTADAVITVTDHVAGELHARHRLDARPRTVINAPRRARQPLPPDQRRPLREECGVGPETPLLVYVGMLAEHRGVFTIVDALTEMPGVHVAFVGSQNATVRQQLHDRAMTHGVRDRLHLLDYVPSHSVTWYIESATCGISALMPYPAHELAMPTKLREYAQAGLPVVASDLDTQSAFVKDHGVGTLFAAGDASSLAAAFHRLLDDQESYRRAVRDPDFLASQTWEGNETALAATWHSLCPAQSPLAEPRSTAPAAAAASQTRVERHPTLVVVGASAADPWAEAWSRFAGDARGHAGSDSEADGDGVLMSEALDSWLEIDRYADAALYRGLSCAHGDVDGGPLSEMLSLQRRQKQVGVLTEAPLVDAALLRDQPGHAFSDWDPKVFGRYRRQALKQARPYLTMLEQGIPLFTSSQRNALMLHGVHWIPAPLPFPSPPLPSPPGEARADSRTPVRILIVPTIRSQAENGQLDRLVEDATRHGFSVRRPRSSRYDPSQAGHADIVVDALTLGEWSHSAAHAWSASRLVVGHLDESLSTSPGSPLMTAPAPPLLESSVDDIVDTVLDLAHALDGAAEAETRRHGRDFAEAIYGGKMAVAGLRGIWNV
ncbi:glycosyltransferase family 4 protein [Citricoccus muralis]|uniref:D-inositol 3-phosphate glycosyltransferase n=1 Tax=Citricoccus muralis TaxID=169134 RepID=A0A3D9LBB0_9MICC|nr:glycosyltransferase family 4 protein [Citricoccus muralis]REE02767.1 glycosyltransferase involved in cell wall biosynthesis [Citricoccus muralis]